MPRNVDMATALHPGSKTSARPQMPSARKPGDLEGAGSPVVGDWQTQEGDTPQSVEHAFEKSDEAVVPKKSTKAQVTLAEPTEGRAEAEGKSAARNASPTLDGIDALTHLRWIGQRAKEKPEEQLSNLLCHIKVPLLKEAYQRL